MKGQLDEQFLRKLVTEGPYPSRAPEDNVADVRAQVAANSLGLARMESFIAKYSLGQVLTAMDQVIQATARRMAWSAALGATRAAAREVARVVVVAAQAEEAAAWEEAAADRRAEADRQD